MKSARQRRTEITKARTQRRGAEQQAATARQAERMRREGVPVNEAALAPYNSYGVPKFVERGFYRDEPFVCAGCGRKQLWTAAQQKWWYEVAKGFVYSAAKLCRNCRRKEQARRGEARRVHLEGLAKKRAPKPSG